MKLQINKLMCLPLFLSALACGCLSKNLSYSPLPKLQNPAAYLYEILHAGDAFTDASGFARLKISLPGTTLNSKNIFLIKRPSFIRFEVLGFLSQPSLFFVTDGASMNLYIPSESTLYSGEATEENLAKIIGIRLNPQEIVQLFFGLPPAINLDDAEITWRQDKMYYLFSVSDGALKHDLWIAPDHKRAIKYRLFDSGTLQYEISFADFLQAGGFLFPLKAEMTHHIFKTKISINFESLSADAVSPDRFTLSPPPQTKYLPFDAFISSR